MKRSIMFFALVLLLAPAASQAADPPVSLAACTIVASKATVNADGIDQAIISVRVKNENLLSVSGATVKLTSSRGDLDEIKPAAVGTTNEWGKVEFQIRSLKNGTANLVVDVNDQRIPATASVQFSNGLDIGLAPGSLIKIPSDNDNSTYADSAVYYFASNGRRYVFPNEKVYFTWYPSFDNVRTISMADMTKIPIGGNVTYRPGSKPVKFQSDDKVYAVDKGGLLRWLKTEDVARAIYGDNWISKVDDINEAFFVNYRFGETLGNAIDFPADTINSKYNTIEKDKSIGQ